MEVTKRADELKPGDRVTAVRSITTITTTPDQVHVVYNDGGSEYMALNVTRTVDVPLPPLPDDWEDLTKQELLKLGAQRGLELKQAMAKGDILDALRYSS